MSNAKSYNGLWNGANFRFGGRGGWFCGPTCASHKGEDEQRDNGDSGKCASCALSSSNCQNRNEESCDKQDLASCGRLGQFEHEPNRDSNEEGQFKRDERNGRACGAQDARRNEVRECIHCTQREKRRGGKAGSPSARMRRRQFPGDQDVERDEGENKRNGPSLYL